MVPTSSTFSRMVAATVTSCRSVQRTLTRSAFSWPSKSSYVRITQPLASASGSVTFSVTLLGRVTSAW